ncbi:AraC family transcriptional regulator [Amphibacillus cookii]|uniref:AraC family transcriptional regulator n=1 Tax=Amphibacillus cookii TaxID=767787 RepID=UPI001956E96B|nr:AraC family transcriptional regulator [Amphibacillus cookii]MBM7540418.1 hypothetical protein [Amphibacillus cookii]
MSKLTVKEHKKLVLKHVIIQKHQNIGIDQLDEKINQFTNQLSLFNVQTFGPLVTLNKGTTIHDDGRLTMDYHIMVQAHDYKQYSKNFSIKERLEFSNCLYVKFKDKPEHLQYAHSKLDLHFYEHDLVADNAVINVLIDENPDQLEVDIFRPVARL